MKKANYAISPMTRRELDLAVEWAAAEGWNPGLFDAQSFYEADPGGFLLGRLDGNPIASISAVRYGNGFGFVGFYIVVPEHRGRGYGLELWNAGLKVLQGCNIGLDGVVAQQDNYKTSGFKLAYRNIRFAGRTLGDTPAMPEIVPLSNLAFEIIDRYDRPFFPGRRSRFLKSWLTQPRSIGLGLLRDGHLTGYGVIRPCRSGYKIGPLFADNPDLAETLYLALNAAVPPGEPLFLDVPEVNPRGVRLAEAHEMTPVFETARMYTGEFPATPFERLFGVTSYELG